MLSLTEENYLKSIYKISLTENGAVSTNALAEALETRPASVSDMIRKLSEKRLVHYEKYRGVFMTEEGHKMALKIIRKHRLWEVFLVKKLKFKWDEVHEVAEQLEHINSPLLIERLDEFLNYPRFDPHGDPIPTANGEVMTNTRRMLTELQPEEEGEVVGLNDTSNVFLQHLDKIGINIGTRIKLLAIEPFDESLQLFIDNARNQIVSRKVGENILLA